MSFDVGDGYGVDWKRFIELKNKWKIVKLYSNQKDQYFGNI